MPAGFWHHMEYMDAGFAMSLRAMQSSLGGKLNGLWNLFGMRGIDTLMKRPRRSGGITGKRPGLSKCGT